MRIASSLALAFGLVAAAVVTAAPSRDYVVEKLRAAGYDADNPLAEPLVP